MIPTITEECVVLTELLELDGQILLWIQESLRCPFLNALLVPYTKLGDHGLIWILITLALLAFKKTRCAGMLSALSLIGSLLVNNIILKNLIARTRPYEVIEGLSILVERQSDLSFPSGHAGSSFAAAVVLAICLWNGTFAPRHRGWSVALIVSAVLMIFSRLYVGVHYPTDVLAGTVTGTLIAVFVYLAFRSVVRRMGEKKETQET